MGCGHNKRSLPPCKICSLKKCYICEGIKKENAERFHEQDAEYRCKGCQARTCSVLEEARLRGEVTADVDREILIAALVFSVQAHSTEMFDKLLNAPEDAKNAPAGDHSQGEDDFFDAAQPTASQPTASQPTATQHSTQSFTTSEQATNSTNRPRLCRSVWTGKACSIPDCRLAHPPRCSDPACRPRRQLDCSNWHTVRTVKRKEPARFVNPNRELGNSKRGKPSPLTTKRAATSLKLEADLAKAKLALFKAKAKTAHRQQGMSYAEAMSKGLSSQAPLLNNATPIPASQPPNLSMPLPFTATPPPEVALQNLAGQIAAAIVAAPNH